MPSKLYTIWLSATAYVVVDFQMLDGEVLAFVVRLVHIVGDESRDVARYDTAHGRPHCDVLSPSGRLRQKHWLKETNFNDALTYAIEDFKANHQAYIRAQSDS